MHSLVENTPDIQPPEVTYPVYDNMPPGPGSLPPQLVRHHWNIPVAQVDQPERERRLLKEPMQLILSHCGAYPPISHQESLALLTDTREGDMAARERLILHFQRFVVYHAKVAYTQAKHLNVPMEDVVQDGMVGLIQAVDKSDVEVAKQHEGTVRSYVSWGIRGSIGKELADRSRLIRIPRNLHDQARNLTLVASHLRAELGREPTDLEIAERMGMAPPKPPELIGLDEGEEYDEFTGRYSERAVNHARSSYAYARAEAATEVHEIMKTVRPMLSFDSPVRDRAGEWRPLHEVYKGEAGEPQEEELEEAAYQSVLRDYLGKAVDKTLNERQQQALELRYGLDGSEPHTLEQTGRIMGITRERVRQLETTATKKLREFSGLRSDDEEELEIVRPPADRWLRPKTYVDRLSSIVAARRNHKNPSPAWAESALEDIVQEEGLNLYRVVAARRREKALAGVESNLEKLADDYLARCRKGSLHVQTLAAEEGFLASCLQPVSLFGSKSTGFNERGVRRVLREYGGLAAFMALSLKPAAMPSLRAWKIARRTLLQTVLACQDDSAPRFADAYCQAVEKAFEQTDANAQEHKK
ncbi:MAG TPA: sigma-70 family RNA polymerase sigma factor [Candidatus Saccharimonadales bacterium]|nr:sigma-70 family RNA polymerase sigma factor [Candidatus Saccharimonadales bacterium]